MNRFNLSEWAIRHRSLVTYFMLIIVVAGVGSYLRLLGRSEDPDFTVKTMVVQVGWPAQRSATRLSRSRTASSASSRRRRVSTT